MIDEYAERAAPQQSRHILASVYLRLPREIRDIVYGFMLGQEKVSVHEKDLCITATDPPLEAGDTARCIYTTSSEPFWIALAARGYHNISPGRVVDSILQELGGAFFSQACYEFFDFDHVPRYLRYKDADFELDLKHLIKTIEVSTFFNAPTGISTTSTVWDSIRKSELIKHMSDYRADLKRLYVLKHGTQITLTLRYDKAFTDPTSEALGILLMEELAMLFPDLAKLVEAGYEVWLKLGYMPRFMIKKGEFNEASWGKKIENHQDVSQPEVTMAHQLTLYQAVHARRLLRAGI